MSQVSKLTLVTGGIGNGSAGGDLACSGLKDEAIIGEDLMEWNRNLWGRLIKLATVALASVDVTGNWDGRRRDGRRKMERERQDWWRLKFLELINEEMAAFISVSWEIFFIPIYTFELKIGQTVFFQSKWIVICNCKFKIKRRCFNVQLYEVVRNYGRLYSFK